MGYVVQQPPTVVTTTVVQNDMNDNDFLISLLIFIFGWFLCCVWCGGFCFIKSKNNMARIFAILSVIMMVLSTGAIIVVVGVEVAAAVATAARIAAI